MYFYAEAFEVEKMLKKTEISENEQFKVKERLESALITLQALREKSSQLMRQCEELKKLRLELKGKVCSKCGEAIESGHEITFRDPAGIQIRYYHKECFEELLTS